MTLGTPSWSPRCNPPQICNRGYSGGSSGRGQGRREQRSSFGCVLSRPTGRSRGAAAGGPSGEGRWPCGHAQQGGSVSGTWLPHATSTSPLGSHASCRGYLSSGDLTGIWRVPVASSVLAWSATPWAASPRERTSPDRHQTARRKRLPQRPRPDPQTHGTFGGREPFPSEHTCECKAGLAGRPRGHTWHSQTYVILGGETSDMPPSCCILRRRGLTSTQIQKSADGKTSVVP